MGVITKEFLEERAAAIKAQITALDAAILALLGGAQSYTLDTGQMRTTVTKTQLGELRLMREHLMSELATIDARLCGGSVHVIPGF